jgi:hypothetical protein
MPRFFFPIRCANLTIDDEQGESFATLHDATVHAAVMAGELAQEESVYEDCAICILDETGAEVACVEIAGIAWSGRCLDGCRAAPVGRPCRR